MTYMHELELDVRVEIDYRFPLRSGDRFAGRDYRRAFEGAHGCLTPALRFMRHYSLTCFGPRRYYELMKDLIYQEMSREESSLDWRITAGVMSDKVLMKTLEESQSSGEKHAVIARVENGELKEAYVSPEAAVKKSFPFDPVLQAFEAYETAKGICLLIVRDNKAVISINGVV